MPARPPRIEVRLQADRICHLSREPRFSLVLFLALHDSESPITLLKHGHGLSTESGPIQSVSILDCLEILDSDPSIQVFGDSQQQGNATRPSDFDEDTDSAGRCALLTLHPHRTEYITFTTAINPRTYELFFNPAALHPGQNYTVRFNASALVTHWTGDRSTREEIQEFAATHHGSLPPPSSPPTAISWDAANTVVTFSTRASAPQPPRVSVSLTAPTVLSCSNNPPFTFSLTFTSHSPKSVTVLAERDRVKLSDSDIEILDAVTRKRVAPDLIDDGNIDGPWRREEFLRLDSEVPYIERRVLDPMRRYSGLEELRVGGVYVLRVLKGKWEWWSEDSVDEVMRYALQRGDGSLGAVPPIDLVCEEEVKFEVVE